MTASRAAVIYGLDADAYTVAHAADRALEGCAARVIYRRENASVWIVGKNEPETSAQLFNVGQQLVVEGGTWRIEDVVSSAQRVQLSRKKGWRKPEGAVNVARPGRWGNPFTLEWVRLADETLTDHEARMIAVQTFRAWLTDDAWDKALHVGTLPIRRARILANLHTLAGKDLCCWCPLPDEGEVDWCHASVLMDLAAAAVTS